MLQDTTAILLAAGESKRFGAENKLLHSISGKPILHHSIDTLLNSKIQQIVVVTGHNHTAIEKSLQTSLNNAQSHKISFCFNSFYQDGQSSSLHAGIRNCINSSAVLVCLADMPHVQVTTINHILQTAQDNTSSTIVAPRFNTKRGNPVLFKQAVFNDLLSIKGDTGAKQYIEKHPERLTFVDVSDNGIHHDYDLAEDFGPGTRR